MNLVVTMNEFRKKIKKLNKILVSTKKIVLSKRASNYLVFDDILIKLDSMESRIKALLRY